MTNPTQTPEMRETIACEHDDFCARRRFWSAACDCGAETAERIVRDVTQAFAQDLKRIMRHA